MNQLKCIFFSVISLILLATSTADVVIFDTCGDNSERALNCTIQELRVTPCPESPCVIKRGSQANLQFDFTTSHPAGEVKSQAYWKAPDSDKPLVGMDRNACTNTPCPVVANQLNTYNNTLSISRKFSPREYNVKWVMWDEEQTNFECCFVFRIKLVK